MKTGIAKFDAGVPPSSSGYEPLDGGPPVIEKGRKYKVPDDYNFKAKQAIFEEVKEKKTQGKTPEEKE